MALNLGDYLLGEGYRLIAETTVDADKRARMLHAAAIGHRTLSVGQGTELLWTRNPKPIRSREVLRIFSQKTAPAFDVALRIGSILGGAAADDDVFGVIDTYSDALGIAFQIVDDLLDYRGDTDATGKNIGDDFRERKLTLPVIKAVALGNAEERAFWTRTIEQGKQEEGDLDHALGLMAKHGTLEATQADAIAWAEKAKAALAILPDHEVKDMLSDLADYVVSRIN